MKNKISRKHLHAIFFNSHIDIFMVLWFPSDFFTVRKWILDKNQFSESMHRMHRKGECIPSNSRLFKALIVLFIFLFISLRMKHSTKRFNWIGWRFIIHLTDTLNGIYSVRFNRLIHGDPVFTSCWARYHAALGNDYQK